MRIPTPGPISWGRQRMLAAIALGLLMAFVFAQSGFAQSDPPLNFGNNFFVTGDYVVAGGQGMTSHLVGGIATGTFSIPDANPGIRGTTTVPRGAQIVAALLYWETVEKSSIMPGDPGSGQNGFFGPVFNNLPQLYPIRGVNLPSHSAVSFSNGGCSGASTGKVVRAYRADVRSFLPRDANGNVLVDSADGVTFEVQLPSTGNQTPFTLGATLVLIYRVISPDFPLNAITIYDGAFAPNIDPNFTMSQSVQGFYQAANRPVSRLTHIVGAGLNNKFQAAYLSGGQNGSQRALVPLPSPYGDGQPAFPGFYGRWDNTTWVFPDPTFPNHPNLANPLQENDDSATATVVAMGANPGCVSWGATIVSTTIHDDDKDGIPPVWKTNKGYTDPLMGQFVSLDDPADEPKTGQQDIFIQLDHVVDPTGDFTPKAGVESAVKSAFLAHNIHLHITDKFAIQETACTDAPNQLCSYPHQPGVTTFPGGFEFLKNQLVDPNGNVGPCTALPTPANCSTRFPLAERNSHHYVVFGDTLGGANWALLGGTLTDSIGTGAGVVEQSNNTITFHTSRGHGLVANDSVHGNGRVNVTGAITNPNLNGTYLVHSVSCPNGDCSVTNLAPGPYTFTIVIGGNPTTFNYTSLTDPNLEVYSGQAGTGSGLSYVGGGGVLVTLGRWGNKNTAPAQAGTFMHELGHNLGLTHGGFYYDHLAPNQNPPDYRPTIGENCKSNYQSVMSYMFQTALLGPSVYSISQTSLTGGVATYVFTLVSGSLPQVGQNVNVSGTTNGMNRIFNVTNAVITSVNLTTNTFTVSIQASDVGPGAESNANATMISTVDFSRQQLNVLNETRLGPITTMGLMPPRIAFPTTSWYDTRTPPVVIVNGVPSLAGTKATHHCDSTPLSSTDPTTYFYEGGTTPLLSELFIPWSAPSLDANFDGKIEASDFRGYNDWANADPRQLGASVLTGPGGLFDGPGGLFDGPGGLFDGPGGLFDGPGGLFDGPGGLFDGPGGLFDGPGGLFDGPGTSAAEIDLATALSIVHRPSTPKATEDASPRVIHLSWTPPTLFDSFNVYRSADGGATFIFLANTPNTSFADTVTCNPTGFQYFVTTVLINTTFNPPKNEESLPSDTVSTGQNGQLLTGCYTFTGFSSPAAGSSSVPGTLVPITWSLQDFSNKNGAFVNNTGANTLVAIGPMLNDQVCGAVTPPNTARTTLPSAGNPITFNPVTNQFSFNWNTTGFAPGCYRVEDDLDSGQPTFGGQPASAFQVQIYLSDVSLTVPTTSLPNGTVGVVYNSTISESGGVVGGPALFTWTVTSGSLPPGVVLGLAGDGVSGALSGTPTAPGSYTFTVKVTDSIGDFGSQTLTLLVNDVVTTTADGGPGSLRQAILDVNASPSGPQPVGILFNIPGTGVQTITPLTPLPPLTKPTNLDATTQPGWTGPPIIELNGSSAGAASVNGIRVTAGSSTVRGLAIHSFSGDGILIDSNGGDVIRGNYIGTNVAGTAALPNGGNGVQIVATPNNVVGGANVISGNGGEGVRIDGTLATNNAVVSNRIGTDATGSFAIGNSASGVYIRRAPGNAVAGNVISGNLGFAGVTICGIDPGGCGGGDVVPPIDETSNAAGNAVEGNFIGTDAAGVNPLSNNQAGVSIDGAPNTQVGLAVAGNGNTISNNGTNDVQIFSPAATGNKVVGNTIHGKANANTVGISEGIFNSLAAGIGNTFSQNSISGHGGLGIDIAPPGINANNTGGANNFPVISSAQVGSGTVSGTLNGPANATFTLEFFSNVACNTSLHGEGAVFLGSRTVTTDGTGNVVFVAPVAGLVAGNIITTTSTDASGTTSEFSGCVTVVP